MLTSLLLVGRIAEGVIRRFGNSLSRDLERAVAASLFAHLEQRIDRVTKFAMADYAFG
jgi:hypothetical protein